jgi:hypothetical protein
LIFSADFISKISADFLPHWMSHEFAEIILSPKIAGHELADPNAYGYRLEQASGLKQIR